jgi:tetratricopeptide (TPR) repeat protein
MVSQIEAWASKALDRTGESTEDKSDWELHAAWHLRHCTDDYEGSVKRAKYALELNPSNWEAILFLASAQSWQSPMPPEEAGPMLQNAKKVMDDLRAKEPEWLGRDNNASLLARVTLLLGRNLWEQAKMTAEPDFTEAARMALESLQYGDPDFEVVQQVAVDYKQARQWSLWNEFLGALTQHSDRWSHRVADIDRDLLIHPYGPRVWVEYDVLIKAADALGQWETVEAFFEACLGACEQQGDRVLLFEFRRKLAFILSMSKDRQRREKGVALLSTLLRADDNDEVLDNAKGDYRLFHVRYQLAICHFRDALAAEQAGAVAASAAIQELAEKMTGLLEDKDVVSANGMDMRLRLVCTFVRFHVRFLGGNLPELARYWIKDSMRNALELLSDETDENDWDGYAIVRDLMIVLEDEENLYTARSMLAALRWRMADAARAEAEGKGEDKDGEAKDTEAKDTEAKDTEAKDTEATNGAASDSGPDVPSAHGEDAVAERADSAGTEEGQTQTAGEGAPDAGNEGGGDDQNADAEPFDFSAISATCDGCTTDESPQGIGIADSQYWCLDCDGQSTLHEKCYRRIVQDGGEFSVFAAQMYCSPRHAFVRLPGLPKELASSFPDGQVPVRGKDASEEAPGFITLEEWKRKLREKYMYEEAVVVA